MSEQIIKDPTLDVEFDPYVKGHQAYEVDAKTSAVRLVQVGNVYPLRDWDFFYVLDGDQYVVAPEMGDIWARDYPERVYEGQKALKAHVNNRWWGGWMQVTEAPGHGPVTVFITAKTRWMFRNNDVYLGKVTALWDGEKLDVEAQTHAWSYHPNIPGFDAGNSPEGHCSIGVGCEPIAIEGDKIQEWIAENIPNQTKEMKDAVDNISLRVSVDPQGGKNPFGEKVIHGPVMHVYNGYVAPLSLQVPLKEVVEPPAPEPPEPPTPEPEPGMEYSKLGPHVIRGAPNLQEHLNAGPAAVKFLGDYHMTVPPGTLIIGRKHDDEAFNVISSIVAGHDPKKRARWWVNELQLSTYLANAHIEYWEGPNEQNVWDDERVDPLEGMLWYAAFEAERVIALAEIGRKAVIGNFATGCPPLVLWPYFFEAIRVGLKYKAIMGMHEYGHPLIWWMTGGYQIDPNEHEGDEGWTTLRYRKVYRQHLIPNDLVIPLVINESGVDALVNPKPPGAPTAQWKYLGDYWRDNWFGPIPYPGSRDEAYAQQLIWYDRELQKDKYVIAQLVYCWGSWGPPEKDEWEKFNVANTGVANRLTEYIRDHPSLPFVWEHYTAKEEDEMEKYDRIYRIADPNFMNEEQLDDAYERGRRALNTTGPAWTDAIPPAENRPDEWRTNRIIVAHMPTADRARYREWAQARDPGTELVFEDGEPG